LIQLLQRWRLETEEETVAWSFVVRWRLVGEEERMFDGDLADGWTF
jgi:hypothetical protein